MKLDAEMDGDKDAAANANVAAAIRSVGAAFCDDAVSGAIATIAAIEAGGTGSTNTTTNAANRDHDRHRRHGRRWRRG